MNGFGKVVDVMLLASYLAILAYFVGSLVYMVRDESSLVMLLMAEVGVAGTYLAWAILWRVICIFTPSELFDCLIGKKYFPIHVAPLSCFLPMAACLGYNFYIDQIGIWGFLIGLAVAAFIAFLYLFPCGFVSFVIVPKKISETDLYTDVGTPMSEAQWRHAAMADYLSGKYRK